MAVEDGRTPPVALVALLVLDFLTVHQFQDANGRIARLLSTCELLRHGYGGERVVAARALTGTTKVEQGVSTS